jgi:hypothetical protein
MNRAVQSVRFQRLRGVSCGKHRAKNVANDRQQRAHHGMTAWLGWTLIVVALGAFSLAVLFPAFWLVRRHCPRFKRAAWAYVAASAVSGVLVWYAIPVAVHGIFGHAAH